MIGRHRAGRALLASLACAGMLLAGCGLPEDSEPRLIAKEDVPFDLAGPSQIDAPAQASGPDAKEIQLYLVVDTEDGPRLTKVTRRIDGALNLQNVLGNLMAGGTTAEERVSKYRNLVPGGELIAVQRTSSSGEDATEDATPATTAASDPCASGDSSSLRIEVEKEFFDRFPTVEGPALAVGQIVLTAMDYRAANRERVSVVQFKVDGQARVVPTDDATKWVSYINSRSYYTGLVLDEAKIDPGLPQEGRATCSADAS